ncbi:hypothetical protein CPIN17260_1522 [Campylobacter pinnipediorum subsp. pinnipediorum]|uniref:hypothetical protein n=1 Tax=Campylobacter pinnipediorum TaxID=1965231 RepID=UPI0009C26EBF|nr:hypothetical protein [Campylobacter pinnipediorum]AQW81799.1 hypothetical protein CPIN17260_1522 [Campylobacter pinnipediorum subsp. pinnipediorum]AQW84996.1 hypothetical protein CPIN17262_1328 [Campylobacter pinnipediorum subsp. pinnipediorum]
MINDIGNDEISYIINTFDNQYCHYCFKNLVKENKALRGAKKTGRNKFVHFNDM